MDRRKLGIIAVGLGVLVIATVIGLDSSNRLPRPEEVAESMAAQLEGLETVKGRLQLVSGKIAIEQELWVERPRRLRMEIEAGPPGYAPVDANHKTTLVLNSEDAWFYNPNLNLTTVADRSGYIPEEGLDIGGSILESMPEAILAMLHNSIDIQVIGEEQVAERDGVRVQILARSADNPFQARTLNVVLDRQFSYPLRIESDSGFILRFDSIEFNQTIDPATFIFVPPPGSAVNRIQR